jgi:uncharacterized protein
MQLNADTADFGALAGIGMKRFGMDLVGVAIMRHNRLVLAACILVTVASAYLLANGLQFNGNVADVLKADTPDYRKLSDVERRFHPFSTDEILVVEAEDLGNPETFTALEDLVSELHLVSGVDAAVSIFTLPGEGNEAGPYLASGRAGRLSPAQRLDHLVRSQPLARDILSGDRTTTVIVLMIAQPVDGQSTGLSEAARDEILALTEAYSQDLHIQLAGIGEIHRSIEQALKRDQRSLTAVSTLLCVLLSLAVFRSWRGSIICGIPPMIGAVWFLGFTALTGMTIDTITTIIPTLLIVVGFSDSVHLYYSLTRARGRGLTGADAIRSAVGETAPACFLTSLTTAFACLGVGLTGSPTLNGFAVAGFAGMIIEFLAVILVLPVLAQLLGPGPEHPRVDRAYRFSALGRAAVGALDYRRSLVAIATGLLVFFWFAQFSLETGFRLSEHLQESGPLRQIELRLADKSLGSGQLFVVVWDADGQKGYQSEDTERLSLAAAAAFPQDVSDIAAGAFPSPAQIDRLKADNHPLLKRYVAQDGLSYLLPVPVTLSANSSEILAKADAIRNRLEEAGLGDQIDIVGLPLLSATEVPRMIGDLRSGFYVALGLIASVLLYSTGSVLLGLLSLVPNLIPILGVEAWLWISGQQLSMTAAVALTIAFGIAVDNSIHFLNRYQRSRLEGDADAVAVAIRDTVSPMTASTLLLAVGLSVTQASSLPTVAVFGQMVAAALVLALFANLFVMPAFLVRGSDRQIR